MTLPPPSGMSQYELDAWHQIQAWKDDASKPGRNLVPEPVKRSGRKVVKKSSELWSEVPGNEKVAAAVKQAVEGGFQLFTDTVAEAVTEQLVLRKYEPHFGYRPRYDELQDLDLQVPDDIAPDMRITRSLTSAATGGAAGFIAGGATAAGAASGGAAALPAAGIIATTIAADTAATLANAAHCAATIGAYYGFDPNEEAERALIMSVIGAGLATGATKQAAMKQVRDVSVLLAQKATWSTLNQKHLVLLMKKIYGALTISTTKKSMAKGLPAAGAFLGAGMNYRSIRRGVITAGYLYRERFLLSKYEGWRLMPQMHVHDIEVVHDEILDEGEQLLGADDPSELERGDGHTGA
jgi:hypothetical protein